MVAVAATGVGGDSRLVAIRSGLLGGEGQAQLGEDRGERGQPLGAQRREGAGQDAGAQQRVLAG